MSDPQLSESALLQRRLWSSDPEGWARYAEGHNRPLFDAVLDAAQVGSGTRLLDVGCGAGMTLQLAAERGAVVAGLDVSEGLLAIARRRLPDADLRVGEIDVLPFEDGALDAVTGVNAFQFAADPVHAFREAARVTRPGGRVVASTFAAPERSESTLVHIEMSKLSPPAREEEHAPYSLSEGDNLERAMTQAGLLIDGGEEVPCDWDYASMSDAVRGLLASAGGARAVEDAGVTRVSETLELALAQFLQTDGSVVMHNTFRWVAASR
jgi:SAM-dependent methyltransferase